MFPIAQLYNFYRHPFIILVRIFILFAVLTLFVFSLEQNTSINLPLGLLLSFGMTELFFQEKFKTIRPQKTAAKTKDDEPYKAFTLRATSCLLKLGNGNEFINTIRNKKEVRFVLLHAGIDTHDLAFYPVNQEALARNALALAKEEEKPYVTVLDVFAAYLLLTEKITKLMFKNELKKEDLLTLIAFVQNIYPEELIVKFPQITAWGAGIGDEWVSGWTLETQKYTRNFTKESLFSAPVLVGRDKEYEMLLEVLARSKQRNILLIGEAGVGKKQIVSYFAYQSFIGDLSALPAGRQAARQGVPGELRFSRVLELLSGILVAGAVTPGDLEERLKNILDEISHSKDVILFIPELQNIAGAGSDSLDITGALLPYLLSGDTRLVATVTAQNYKRYFADKGSFLDAFEKIYVEEPGRDEAVPMLLDASLALEQRHKVVFSYKACVSAVALSEKYMPGRFLPGKAISFLDEAAARARINNKQRVEEEDITALIEEKIHVKIAIPKKEERTLLLNLEEVLHRRIINQKEAVSVVSESLRRLRSGLAFEGRPVGTFLFMGPTGVGKTELAKALSEVYFGSEEAMIRFDMSEYQDRSAADRLVEELTDKVEKAPFSLILLDEFEKAYLSLLDIFLSVFEDGRLTNAQGLTVSFENTIIIATSNAGAEFIREQVNMRHDLEAMKPQLLDILQRNGIFKPELLNRFDAIVLFVPLGQEEVEQVTALFLKKVVALLEKKDVVFTFDKKAIVKIAKEGFDQTMGARPLRRFIQDNVEDLLSEKILRDEIKRGDTATLSTDAAGNLTLDVKSEA